MAFFDDSFMKKDEENKNNNNNLLKDLNVEDKIPNNNELDVNRKNREKFESLMDESKSNKDMYYDKNNIFVKLILFILLVFIILGIGYYVLQYFGH